VDNSSSRPHLARYGGVAEADRNGGAGHRPPSARSAVAKEARIGRPEANWRLVPAGPFNVTVCGVM
jgi:hypothetical protein